MDDPTNLYSAVVVVFGDKDNLVFSLRPSTQQQQQQEEQESTESHKENDGAQASEPQDSDMSTFTVWKELKDAISIDFDPGTSVICPTDSTFTLVDFGLQFFPGKTLRLVNCRNHTIDPRSSALRAWRTASFCVLNGRTFLRSDAQPLAKLVPLKRSSKISRSLPLEPSSSSSKSPSRRSTKASHPPSFSPLLPSPLPVPSVPSLLSTSPPSSPPLELNADPSLQPPQVSSSSPFTPSLPSLFFSASSTPPPRPPPPPPSYNEVLLRDSPIRKSKEVVWKITSREMAELVSSVVLPNLIQEVLSTLVPSSSPPSLKSSSSSSGLLMISTPPPSEANVERSRSSLGSNAETHVPSLALPPPSLEASAQESAPRSARSATSPTSPTSSLESLLEYISPREHNPKQSPKPTPTASVSSSSVKLSNSSGSVGATVRRKISASSIVTSMQKKTFKKSQLAKELEKCIQENRPFFALSPLIKEHKQLKRLCSLVMNPSKAVFVQNQTRVMSAAAYLLVSVLFPVETIKDGRQYITGRGVIPHLLEMAKDDRLTVCNEVIPDDVEIVSELARGATATVKLAKYQGQTVVVKVFNPLTMYLNKAEFLFESSVTTLLQHPNLLPCLGVCLSPDSNFIVLPFCQDGSLMHKLADESVEIDWVTKISIAHQIAEAMKFLHSFNIIHRDLKSENVLLDSLEKIYVADLGASRVLNSTMTSNIGTTAWIAPEVFEGGEYSLAADVYSFGIVLWEIVSRKFPYEGVASWHIPQKVMTGDRPVIPSSCPKSVSQLITDCWQANPKRRPTFAVISDSLQEILLRLLRLTASGSPSLPPVSSLRASVKKK